MAELDRLPDVLTVDEVAAYLRVGRNLAYRLVASGQLSSIRVGRSIRVIRTALLAYLENRSDD